MVAVSPIAFAMVSMGKPVAPRTITGFGFVSSGQGGAVVVGSVDDDPPAKAAGVGPRSSGSGGRVLAASKPAMRVVLSKTSYFDVVQAVRSWSFELAAHLKQPRPPN